MTKATVYHRTTCRLCNSDRLALLISYPFTPIADAYVTVSKLEEPQELFPLDLYICAECGHVQLCDVVNPELLFTNYVYETSVSLGLVEHFRRYADDIMTYAPPPANALAVEIGSNDGSLLRFLKKHGLKVLGVDPAKAIARKATESGIETIPKFFTSELAKKIKEQHGKAFIITANNVFAHADNLGDIADGIATLLHKDGIFCFEVSYLPDIVEKKLFDTVYHEHLCYHSVKPLQRFFHYHGLELIDFIRISTKGGSFRGVACHAYGSRQEKASIKRQIEYEVANGYDRVEPFRSFVAELENTKKTLSVLLSNLKSQGKSIVGYGASATVTTIMYYFGLGGFLDFLVDENPRKHNTFSPGYHLPVFPSQALYDHNPDYVVVLAWNYSGPIMDKHQAYREKGGQFIIPMPQLEIH
jgi:hypothetical protein